MIRTILILIIFVFSTMHCYAAETDKQGRLSQRDLAVELVQSLGWSFGLPDEPENEDYLTILNGRRTWRFEFEDIVIPDAEAPLAPKEILTFGKFSGKNWQRAPGRRITPRLEFLLPLSGRYTIKASLFKPGYQLAINEHELAADGTTNFSKVTFGTIDLTAGRLNAEMTIPSRGGIDYIVLEAPPARNIAPHSGWEFDRPLENRDMAVTALQALELEGLLPGRPETLELEAESAPTPSGAVCCTDLYKGPIKGEWVRSDSGQSEYSHLFEIEQPGVYDLSMNVQGKSPFSGMLNGKDYFKIDPKPYFTEIYSGSFFLEKGTNQIEINIPHRGGLDRFSFRARSSSPDDYLQLAGLADTPTTPEELNRFLRLVAAIGTNR